MKKLNLLFGLIAIVLLASCHVEKDYLVTIKTNYGDMQAILYDETPKHKDNFIKLAKEGYFDSTLFHRVIKDFMIQGGDPDSKNAKPGQPLGLGNPGYKLPAEFNSKFSHFKGALSAARQPDERNPEKKSSGSQFYIVHGKKWTEPELTVDMKKLGETAQLMMRYTRYDSIAQMLKTIYETQGGEAYGKKLIEMKDFIAKEMQVEVDKTVTPERLEGYKTIGGAPHLDDEYTVFGMVINGLEVIDKIATQPVGRANRPTKDVRMTISVDELPKKKITQLYGYEFPIIEK